MERYTRGSLQSCRLTLLLLVSALLGMSENGVLAQQKCDHDCGPFGDCVRNSNTNADEERTTCADGHCDDADSNNNDDNPYTCQCHSGYSGSDCSFRAPTPCRITGLNATLCYNGGTCEEYTTTEGMAFRCNCQAAYGEADVHAGPQCEHDTTDVCEAGRASSHYAFCTNEGQCKAYVVPGEDHPGCDCTGTGFEGRHCQFVEGTAPAEEIIYIDSGGYQAPSVLDGDKSSLTSSRLSGMQVFLIVAIVGSVVAIGAFVGSFVWKAKTSKRNNENTIELNKVQKDDPTQPEPEVL